MQACRPKAVATAVSTVMITLRILPQTDLFSFSIFNVVSFLVDS